MKRKKKETNLRILGSRLFHVLARNQKWLRINTSLLYHDRKQKKENYFSQCTLCFPVRVKQGCRPEQSRFFLTFFRVTIYYLGPPDHSTPKEIYHCETTSGEKQIEWHRQMYYQWCIFKQPCLQSGWTSTIKLPVNECSPSGPEKVFA